jgi:hypothetical protein
MVGNKGMAWLPVFDLDYNRAIAAPSLEFPCTATTVPSSTQPGVEAFREEGKNIKDSRFAAAIGSEQHSQRSDIFKLYLVEGAKIFDTQVLDPGRRPRGNRFF